MPDPRHFTTRRGFIAGLGFGAVSLYGAWAAYGAAPLPFAGMPAVKPNPDAHGDGHGGGHADGHSDHGAANGPVDTPAGGHDAPAGMSSEEFRTEHDLFIRTHARKDGSVDPHADNRGHDHGHGTQEHGAQEHDQGHGSSASEPLPVYLMAQTFAYSPDLLHLRAGQPYRFRLMADDITHGASIQLGNASRIIRLRPNIVTEQTITFTRAGEYLVYCTVYCGQAHDAMQGRITVA